MVPLIFISYENLKDLETLGIFFFYFGRSRLTLRIDCFLEMGYILFVLPELSTAVIYAMYPTITHLCSTPKISENHKTKVSYPLLLPFAFQNSIPTWNVYIHLSVYWSFCQQISHHFSCPHSTCLFCRGIMEDAFCL